MLHRTRKYNPPHPSPLPDSMREAAEAGKIKRQPSSGQSALLVLVWNQGVKGGPPHLDLFPPLDKVLSQHLQLSTVPCLKYTHTLAPVSWEVSSALLSPPPHQSHPGWPILGPLYLLWSSPLTSSQRESHSLTSGFIFENPTQRPTHVNTPINPDPRP